MRVNAMPFYVVGHSLPPSAAHMLLVPVMYAAMFAHSCLYPFSMQVQVPQLSKHSSHSVDR